MNDEADTSTSSDKPPPTKKKVFVVSEPSEDEKDAFYKELSQCKGKPVILSLNQIRKSNEAPDRASFCNCFKIILIQSCYRSVKRYIRDGFIFI